MSNSYPLQIRIENEIRSLCADDNDSDVSFLVGTCKAEGPNFLYSVIVKEGKVNVSKFSHDDGAIVHISASHTEPGIFATVCQNLLENRLKSSVFIYNKSTGHDKGTTERISNLSKVHVNCDDCHCAEWEPQHSREILIVALRSSVYLFDGSNNFSAPKTSFVLAQDFIAPVVRWDSLSSGQLIGLADRTRLCVIDLRTCKESIVFGGTENSHHWSIRDLDFNPTRVNELATCGEDGRIRIWDIRHPSEPERVFGRQGHWVHSIRYNPSYDHLILSGGNDSSVQLYSVSKAQGTRVRPVDDEDGAFVKIYDDHEDSVYAVDWSRSNNWCFGSVSYDGTMIVHCVTADVQLETLLAEDSADDDL